MNDPLPDARFRVVYSGTREDVARFVRRRAEDSAVDDIVADVFTTVWRRIDDLPRTDDAARAWIFGVARNTLINAHRSDARRRAVAVKIADAQPSATDHTDSVIDHLLLVQAWRDLPEHHQETLALLLYDGLTPAQAAKVIGITGVAFRLRLSRARKALRARLDSPLRNPDRPVQEVLS